jgi:hypothetical protein
MYGGPLKVYNIYIGMVVSLDHKGWGVPPWGGCISRAFEENYYRGILMDQIK